MVPCVQNFQPQSGDPLPNRTRTGVKPISPLLYCNLILPATASEDHHPKLTRPSCDVVHFSDAYPCLESSRGTFGKVGVIFRGGKRLRRHLLQSWD